MPNNGINTDFKMQAHSKFAYTEISRRRRCRRGAGERVRHPGGVHRLSKAFVRTGGRGLIE